MVRGMEQAGGGQLLERAISCPRTRASSGPAAACLGLGWASGLAQHRPSQVDDFASRLSAAQIVPQPPLAAGLIMLPPLTRTSSMREQIKTSLVSNYVAMGEAISSWRGKKSG